MPVSTRKLELRTFQAFSYLIVHLTHSRPPPPWLSRGWQGAAPSCTPAWPWMAAAPVKASESLAESQMRQLDNQV
jgi:hypothetical protein